MGEEVAATFWAEIVATPRDIAGGRHEKGRFRDQDQR